MNGKLESVITLPRGSQWLDGPPLTCPRCKSTNLHHGVVTVFSRSEDAEVVLVTRAGSGDVRRVRRHYARERLPG